MSDPRPTAGAARGTAAFLNRELALLVILAAAGVVSFLATRALAVSNANLRRHDAAAWHSAGREALSSGNLPRALTALRRAARIDRNDRDVAIALASALQASGSRPEAVQVLESLRDRRPDDPDVNLELARLEASSGELPLAIRYYQDALDALWSPDAAPTSRNVRVEFIELLLRKGQRVRALAQTLILAADLPPEREWLLRAGRLFLDAGDPRRALARFSSVLDEDGSNPTALAGAGEAAFELGDFARARQWLSRVDRPEPRVAAIREVADLVLSADPLAPRLALAERARRTDALIERARARLQSCGTATADATALMQTIDAAATDAATPARRGVSETRDRAEDALSLASRAEHLSSSCGNPTPLDRAIPLIATLRGLEESR